jgi:hypothetical protein
MFVRRADKLLSKKISNSTQQKRDGGYKQNRASISPESSTSVTIHEEESMASADINELYDHYPPPSTGHGSRRVDCDNETLLRQAPMTAQTYMACALHDIDALFGKRYAKAHPELIAAYMQTAAIDFAAGEIGRAIESLGDAISRLREQP